MEIGEACIKLPLLNSIIPDLNTLQTKWKSIIDPIISNPLLNGRLIVGQQLINGSTSVNHKLGRNLVGWIIVGRNGSATIYDTQASNQQPSVTLNLTSSAAVTVNLWVF